VPTTLLAMIDSSIGGKTGVDVAQGKNLLGAFHQPTLVVADLDVLATLPGPQLVAGMAEAIKHGVIADAGYCDLLEREQPAIGARDFAVLERVVVRSVEIKAEVVSGDEREAGRRAVLNFGHTVGHAIEATSGYALLHGEAVAIGMALEARIAERSGTAEAGTAARVAALLERFGLPREAPLGATVDDLLTTMGHDKKVRSGEIRLALPRRVGAMHGDAQRGWTVAVSEDLLREVLGATPAPM
jgi:3-dehydroquinate synthase